MPDVRNPILMLLAISGCTATPAHAGPTFPDRGRAGVVDAAHILPNAARAALNERVVAWDRATGHQLAVVTVPDLQGLDVKSYGYQLGRAWGLGDARRRDGTILLLSMKPHEVRIEVGYGLEPVLTDAATSQILRDQVVPKLKAGNIPGALDAGAGAIMAIAGAEKVQPAQPSLSTGSGEGWWWLGGGLAAIGAGWAALSRRRRQRQQRLADMAAAARAKGRPAASSPEAVAIAGVKAAIRNERGVREAVEARLQRSKIIPPSPPARRAFVAPAPAPTPSYVPPAYVAPSYDPPTPSRRDDDSSSSSSSSWGSFDSGSSSSSSSDSSSSGFDSGGGSFGGGGSDSSW